MIKSKNDVKEKRGASPIRILFLNDDGTMRYAPGAKIEGRVEIHPDQTINCRQILVTCSWWTEGKGNRDEGIVRQETLTVSSIEAHEFLKHEFAYQLPRQPWSYAGHLINIIWGVRVKIDIPMGRDIEEVQRFVLHPAE